MAENDSDFGVFLAGFIVGSLVGAATALLMAPKSGEETRTIIKEKSIVLKDEAMKSTEDVRAKAETVVADARTKAETAASEVKVKAKEVSQHAKEQAETLSQRSKVLLEEQKGKVGKAVETVKSRVKTATPVEEIPAPEIPVVEDKPPAPPADVVPSESEG